MLLADSSLIEHRKQIAELARHAGLLTATQRREYVEAGGVLSYGPNLTRQIRETASYVHRIIEGAKPADLPVAQLINLTTAKAPAQDVIGTIGMRRTKPLPTEAMNGEPNDANASALLCFGCCAHAAPSQAPPGGNALLASSGRF